MGVSEDGVEGRVEDSSEHRVEDSSEDRVEASSEASGPCFLCCRVTELQCPQCPAWVCGDQCHLYHRQAAAPLLPLVRPGAGKTTSPDPGHCQPFTLRTEPGRGRYLVATRDIAALELVIRDAPLVVAPPAVTPPLCLECLAPLASAASIAPCPACGVPLCAACAAAASRGLHAAECDLLRGRGVRLEPGELGSNNLLYACILPLRMWRTRTRDPGTWRRINFLQVKIF